MDGPVEGSATSKTPPRSAGSNQIVTKGPDGVERVTEVPRPLRSVQPNCLGYVDGDGVSRRIYLPQGALPEAYDHYQNKRWDELAKYAPYTGQGYSEEDYKYNDALRESSQSGDSHDARGNSAA